MALTNTLLGTVNDGVSSTTAVITTTVAAAIGDTVAVLLLYGKNGVAPPTVSSVVDSAGNTYTLAPGIGAYFQNSSTGESGRIAYCLALTGALGVGATITATFSAAATYKSAAAIKVTGATGPLAVRAQGGNGPSNVNAGPGAFNAVVGDAAVAGAISAAGNTSVTNAAGWTQDFNATLTSAVGARQSIIADRIVASTTTTWSPTSSPSNNFAGSVWMHFGPAPPATAKFLQMF